MSGEAGVAVELCRVRTVRRVLRRVLPVAAGLRHKYIGVNSGSLVGLVSKTNIFLY